MTVRIAALCLLFLLTGKAIYNVATGYVNINITTPITTALNP